MWTRTPLWGLTQEKLSVDIISTSFFLNLSCLEYGRNNFTSIEPQSNHKMFVPKLGANTQWAYVQVLEDAWRVVFILSKQLEASCKNLNAKLLKYVVCQFFLLGLSFFPLFSLAMHEKNRNLLILLQTGAERVMHVNCAWFLLPRTEHWTTDAIIAQFVYEYSLCCGLPRFPVVYVLIGRHASFDRHQTQAGMGFIKFSVFTSYVIKTKNRNHTMNKVKNLGYDRRLIYKHPRQELGLCFICRSVSPKIIELRMETPCLSPSKGHKHGGRKVTAEISVTEFSYWNDTLK